MFITEIYTNYSIHVKISVMFCRSNSIDDPLMHKLSTIDKTTSNIEPSVKTSRTDIDEKVEENAYDDKDTNGAQNRKIDSILLDKGSVPRINKGNNKRKVIHRQHEISPNPETAVTEYKPDSEYMIVLSQ